MSNQRAKARTAIEEPNSTEQGIQDLQEAYSQSNEAMASQEMKDVSERVNEILANNNAESAKAGDIGKTIVDQVKDKTGVDLQSDDLRNKAGDIGKTIVDQVKDKTGVDLQSDDLRNKAGDIGKTIVDQVKDKTGVDLQSDDLRNKAGDVGKTIVDQVKDKTGVDLQSDDLRNKAGDIGQTIVDQVKDKTGVDLQSDDLRNKAGGIGQTIVDQVKDKTGVDLQSDDLRNKAGDVGQTIVDQVKDKTGVDLQSDDLRNKAGDVGQTIVDQVKDKTGVDLQSEEAKAAVSAMGGAVVSLAVEEQLRSFCQSSDCQEVQEAVGRELVKVAGMLGEVQIPFSLDSVVGAFGVLGDVAYACPMLAPVGLILVGVSSACKQAKYNREQADFMRERVDGISATMKRLSANLQQKGAKDSASVLEPLLEVLKEAFEYISRITRRGFMKSLFTYSADRKTLQQLDKQITDATQALHLAVANEQVGLRLMSVCLQLELSLQMDEKLVRMMAMLEKGVPAGCKEPAQIDAKVLVEIAERSGCKMANEMKEEIGSMSEAMMKHMEQVTAAVSAIQDKLHDMDRKSDVHHEEDMLAHQKTQYMIAEGNVESKKAAAQTLQAVMSIAARSGGVQPKWSSKREAELLTKEATHYIDCTSDVAILTLHQDGIGMDERQLQSEFKRMDTNRNGYLSILELKTGLQHSKNMSVEEVEDLFFAYDFNQDGNISLSEFISLKRPNLEGQQGQQGEDGENFAGTCGQMGEPTRNGEPGQDGGDGQSGLDGANGLDLMDFEVMLEFVREDLEARTRTYRIEHSGPKGKVMKEVELPYPEGILYVNARGGSGGQGGRGGSGGDGGNGGDGGRGEQSTSGGDGGDGGDGGNPGRGGCGGNGGNSSRVKINTNDPALLMLVKVDVSGGAPGQEGRHGNPGRGGRGGRGGEGSVYYES
ncbi:hypothetical protein GUITHDRAFT_122813, partial [Guillardia theta CCMP2712]